MQTSILNDAISHLLKRLPMDPETKQWKALQQSRVDEITELPALLKILTGMVYCYLPIDEVIVRSGVIPLLLELDKVPSKEGIIGDLARRLVVAMSFDNSQCGAAIENLDAERRAQEQEQAKKAREAAQGAEGPSILHLLNELDDEPGWCCPSCDGGYRAETHLLGLYVRVQSVAGCSVTSSLLTPIHYRCHDEAKRLEPDQEWQKASRTNSGVPCNAIFPVPDYERVTPDAYRAALVAFYAPFGNPPIASVVRDITTQFIGMADGKTVGNKFAFLPLLVYAGHILLEEKCQARGAMEHRMMQILRGADNDPCDGLGLSLLVLTTDEWLHVRFALLRVIIRHVPVGQQDDDDALFKKLKHVLFAWSIVHEVHMAVLANQGDTPVEDDGDGVLVIPSHFEADWVQKFMKDVEANPKDVSENWKSNAGKWEDSLAKAVSIDAMVDEWVDTLTWDDTLDIGPKDWIRSCIA
jgi:hypothetical protein